MILTIFFLISFEGLKWNESIEMCIFICDQSGNGERKLDKWWTHDHRFYKKVRQERKVKWISQEVWRRTKLKTILEIMTWRKSIQNNSNLMIWWCIGISTSYQFDPFLVVFARLHWQLLINGCSIRPFPTSNLLICMHSLAFIYHL